MKTDAPITTLALASHSADLGFLVPPLKALAPALDIVTWPDPRCAQAEVVAGWDAPPGLREQFPRMRLLHSIAAGVDNLIRGQDLQGVPVCRVVDPLLAQGMVQYVLWGVLHFHRQFDVALGNQRHRLWSRPVQSAAKDCRIGILGLGELGSAVAQALIALGYSVAGWSRTGREMAGVRAFRGEQGLPAMLSQTDVLICLLPLTPATRGLLDRQLFEALPRGAALIQCGRGEQLVEQDLCDAVVSGRLRGALLDVFEREPLPSDHPLWSTPGVLVTPHMATMARTEVVAQQIVDNIARLNTGQALHNAVDIDRGY